MNYFPDNIFNDVSYNSYSSFLSEMKHESIYEMRSESSKHFYRLLLMRAFNNPIVITIEIFDNDYGKLHYIEYNIGELFSKNEIVIESYVNLSPEDVNNLYYVINEFDFWNAPSKNPYPTGLDGSNWIIEGLNNCKYHFIERWMPLRKDNVAAGIGLCMLGLSKIKIDIVYLY